MGIDFKGFPQGFDGNIQIGRTPPLSSNKSKTHFPILHKNTGIPYSGMLFFDGQYDSHACTEYENAYSIVTNFHQTVIGKTTARK